MVAPCRDKWLWTSPLLSKTLKMSAYCGWHTLLALMGPSLPSLIHFWTAFWPRECCGTPLSCPSSWCCPTTPIECSDELQAVAHSLLSLLITGAWRPILLAFSTRPSLSWRTLCTGPKRETPTQRPHGEWQHLCRSHEYQLDFRGWPRRWCPMFVLYFRLRRCCPSVLSPASTFPIVSESLISDGFFSRYSFFQL
jgi:hypothetical protein